MQANSQLYHDPNVLQILKRTFCIRNNICPKGWIQGKLIIYSTKERDPGAKELIQNMCEWKEEREVDIEIVSQEQINELFERLKWKSEIQPLNRNPNPKPHEPMSTEEVDAMMAEVIEDTEEPQTQCKEFIFYKQRIDRQSEKFQQALKFCDSVDVISVDEYIRTDNGDDVAVVVVYYREPLSSCLLFSD